MGILKDDPIFFRILQSRLILERFGIGLEIDDISAVFLTAEDLFHCRFPPFVGVGLGFLPSSAYSLGLPVSSTV